jgi:hypothetical protein
MRLAFFTLATLTCALVAVPKVFAQGAVVSRFSFNEPAQFTDVSCVGDADSKPLRGELNFDASTNVRCESADGAGFTIPYAAVTRLVLHEGEKADTSSRFSFHELLPRRDVLKTFATDRYLTIYFNDGDGHARSSVVRLDNKDWQMVLAVAQNKTGRTLEQNVHGENWKWGGNW